MQIRITKSDFVLISEILDDNHSYFISEKINNSEMLLSFNSAENAFEFDELIKDKLVYQGFDIDYNPNQFGQMCENIIDKMHEIIK